MSSRLQRVRDAAATAGIDGVLLSIGPDLRYVTGFEASPSERLTMGVMTATDAVIVVPRLEAPLVGERDGFEIRAWEETEDPLDLVAALLADDGRYAIGDHTWTTFTLGLQARRPGAAFHPASMVMSALRRVKDDQEIAALSAAASGADRVAARLAGTRFSGVTEAVLSRRIADMLLEEGHDEAWGAIVASGPNGASPHHHAGDRVMAPGDVVVVDFGGRVDGYHSDTTRTFSIGEPPPEVAEAHTVLAAAQSVGRRAATAGTPAAEVDRVTRQTIAEAGFGEWFVHRTGHGIGLEVHEAPYLVEGNDEPLAVGNAFSVEPGIYRPGEWGMRIEDIVVVTADGPAALNDSSRALTVVE